MVPEGGIEPPNLSALASKASVFTYFTILAYRVHSTQVFGCHRPTPTVMTFKGFIMVIYLPAAHPYRCLATDTARSWFIFTRNYMNETSVFCFGFLQKEVTISLARNFRKDRINRLFIQALLSAFASLTRSWLPRSGLNRGHRR